MLVYVLKSTICLILLLGFYHLVLEKEKMHQFNRFYLIGSILFSFIVPSFIITIPANNFVAPLIMQSQDITNTIAISPDEIAQNEVNYIQYLTGLYILVSSILFFLFVKRVHQLILKARKNKKVNYFNATIVLLKEKVLPHSFFNYIFINKNSYQAKNLEQQILTHELTHVRQKHSLDVLFIEILQNLFWCIPIFRFYKKAIQLNHEFLADDAVINTHKNIAEYQHLLLNKTAQLNNIYLASNLNYSLTKKRLLMMTTPSSKIKILFKKLIVFPLIAGFIFAFAERVEAQKKPQIIEIQKEEPTFKSLKTNTPLVLKVKDTLKPPPPPVDLVYTYKRLAKKIQKTSKNRKANKRYLKKLYGKMNVSQKKQVKKPALVLAPKPIVIEVVEKKKKTKLPSKPQIREVEEILVEELTEIEEIPEIEKEEVLVEELEVIDEIEVVKEEEVPIKIERIKSLGTQKDFINKMHKKNAKFYYLKKPISFSKALNLVQNNRTLRIYASERKNKKPKVYISKLPEVIEIVEDQKYTTVDKLNELNEEEIIDLSKIQKTNSKKIYYINNKKVSERKFKRLKLNTIQKLRIKKGKDKVNHIYITTKN